MSTFQFFQLPPEIFLECIESLDYKALLVCRQVCRKLRDIVDENPACQYTLDLFTHGLEDSCVSTLELSERRDALQKYVGGWNSLKWSKELEIPHSKGKLWELYGGVLTQTNEQQDFVFTRLPAVARGIEEKKWTIDKRDYEVRDYGMDPSQDLLVLVEKPYRTPNTAHIEFVHRLHFLSLEKSPGAPHPLAKGGHEILHCQNFRDPGMSLAIQVSGDFAGILFNTVEAGVNEFIVWNWKTGARILYITGDEARAFSFLSDTLVLFCVLNRAIDEEPKLAVVDFAQSTAAGEPQNILAMSEITFFGCPAFCDSAGIVEFGVRADPAPAWRPDAQSNLPFHLSRNNRIYVVTLWIQVAVNVLPHWVNIFVPSKTLISALEDFSKVRKDSDDLTIPWERWGPHGTRLLMSNVPQSSVWVCYVYGTRYVALEPHQAGKDKVWCRVFDFNDLPTRRGVLDVKPDNIITQDHRRGMISPWISEEVVYQAGPLTVEASRIFKNDVTTSLPFRWKSVELNFSATQRKCAVMCSEDNVIVMDGNTKKFYILTV